MRKVVGDFLAEIELDDGALVMIDQQELETIIPKAGKKVLIVNGAERKLKEGDGRGKFMYL